MKRVLILGSNGLLGYAIYNFLLNKKNVELYSLSRKTNHFKKNKKIKKLNFFVKNKINNKIKDEINTLKPNIVINCIGITKNKNTSKKNYFLVNSKFPIFLSKLSERKGFKFVHISTDCVFNGLKGDYKEANKVNAKDIYGLSKIRGEYLGSNTTILRTSVIGHSIKRGNGLLEWFLNQSKEINGFNQAYFTGPTSLEISKIIYNYLILENKIPNEIVNIGLKKISKYTLLKILKKIYKKNIKIIKYSNFKIDRSLNTNYFRRITKHKILTWEKAIKQEKLFFSKIRK